MRTAPSKPDSTRNGRHAAAPRTPSTSTSDGALTPKLARRGATTSDDPLIRLYDQERRKIRLWLTVAITTLALVVAGLAVGFYVARSTAAQANTERDVAATERDVAATSADALAGKVLTDCAADPANPVAGPDAETCEQARAVQDNPVVQAAARDGRGIASTAIVDRHLIVTYDDGTSRDAGIVVGADGRGVADIVLDGGRLVLVYSDGARVDLGRIIGRGIAGVSTAGGRLTVTYDDGSTEDAGELPVGPTGDRGAEGAVGRPGPACPDGYKQVETGRVSGTDGVEYGRSVTCVDPASATPAPDPGGGSGG